VPVKLSVSLITFLYPAPEGATLDLVLPCGRVLTSEGGAQP
jgi:hypothetical protein